MTTATLTMETPSGLRIDWSAESGFSDIPGTGLARLLSDTLDRCPHGSHLSPQHCAEWAVREVFGPGTRTREITPDAWPNTDPETVV